MTAQETVNMVDVLDSVADAISCLATFANSSAIDTAGKEVHLETGIKAINEAITHLVEEARKTITSWKRLGFEYISDDMNKCCDELVNNFENSINLLKAILKCPDPYETKKDFFESEKSVIRSVINLLRFNDLYEVASMLRTIKVVKFMLGVRKELETFVVKDFIVATTYLSRQLIARTLRCHDSNVRNALTSCAENVTKYAESFEKCYEEFSLYKSDQNYVNAYDSVSKKLEHWIEVATKQTRLSLLSPFDLSSLEMNPIIGKDVIDMDDNIESQLSNLVVSYNHPVIELGRDIWSVQHGQEVQEVKSDDTGDRIRTSGSFSDPSTDQSKEEEGYDADYLNSLEGITDISKDEDLDMSGLLDRILDSINKIGEIGEGDTDNLSDEDYRKKQKRLEDLLSQIKRDFDSIGSDLPDKLASADLGGKDWMKTELDEIMSDAKKNILSLKKRSISKSNNDAAKSIPDLTNKLRDGFKKMIELLNPYNTEQFLDNGKDLDSLLDRLDRSLMLLQSEPSSMLTARQNYSDIERRAWFQIVCAKKQAGDNGRANQLLGKASELQRGIQELTKAMKSLDEGGAAKKDERIQAVRDAIDLLKRANMDLFDHSAMNPRVELADLCERQEKLLDLLRDGVMANDKKGHAKNLNSLKSIADSKIHLINILARKERKGNNLYKELTDIASELSKRINGELIPALSSKFTNRDASDSRNLPAYKQLREVDKRLLKAASDASLESKMIKNLTGMTECMQNLSKAQRAGDKKAINSCIEQLKAYLDEFKQLREEIRGDPYQSELSKKLYQDNRVIELCNQIVSEKGKHKHTGDELCKVANEMMPLLDELRSERYKHFSQKKALEKARAKKPDVRGRITAKQTPQETLETCSYLMEIYPSDSPMFRSVQSSKEALEVLISSIGAVQGSNPNSLFSIMQNVSKASTTYMSKIREYIEEFPPFMRQDLLDNLGDMRDNMVQLKILAAVGSCSSEEDISDTSKASIGLCLQKMCARIQDVLRNIQITNIKLKNIPE
ncbi:uncharacterized protein LOC126318459 [Schistocerca gregaria]|uniref:uncharacterized protein LOC126318459 n=1 Tax=Schistocerca gregaria TaxID=7010 RepID=UPI00211F3243|nr:uncharacterized protein LOC126318459 [Schistocerca gregaria]